MRILAGSGQVGRAARRRWRAVLAVSVAVAAAPAQAEEGGFFGFLRSALGGESAPAAAPPSAQGPAEGRAPPPLTVRRSPRKAHGESGRARFAHLPGKTGPVSIFEDPTLRDGDAVMTKTGMKVFAGGRFSPDHPYNEADFVTVSSAKTMAPGLRKTVIELNKLPPG